MTNPRTGRAFTLVELLVVVAIITILIGILIPTGVFVLGNARRASNLQLMKVIGDGLYSFNQDLRYYPPILAPQPDPARLFYTPDHTLSNNHLGAPRTATERAEELEERRWHSVASLPLYLLGTGSLAPLEADSDISPRPRFYTDTDPNHEDRHDGAAGLGIRDPGPDRSWGGAADRGRHFPSFQGRVYGPYIDPNIADGNMREARIEDFPYRTSLPQPFTENDLETVSLFVFVDRFDSPIRYYKDWPERDPNFTPPPGASASSLRLAPLELISHEVAQNYTGSGSGSVAERNLVDNGLIGKPYALLSAGADGRWGERQNEESITTPLLLGEDIDTVPETGAGGTNPRALLFRTLRDNQRVTP